MVSSLPINIRQEVSRCLLCYDAPCSKACPAQNRPDRFIRAVYFNNVLGAVRMMMEANPFSKLCAQDCKGRAFCQKACVRRKIDRPIEIPEIQLYLANQAEKMAYELDISPKNGEKVVIIGDTPASLVAAVMLSLRGVLVQLFYIGAHEIDPHMQHILRVTSVDYTVVDSNSSLQGIHAKIGVIMAKESDVLQQSLCGCEKIFIAKYESKVVMIVHFVKKGMAMAEQVWAYIGKEARENE